MTLFCDNSSINIKTSAKSIFVNDSFELTVSFDNFDDEISIITQDGFDNFKLLGQPYQSTQSSTSVVNGKAVSTKSIVLTYNFLANKIGNFSVGPVVAKSNGMEFKSNTVSINVYKQGDNVPQDKTINQMFIRTVTSKNSIFPGENIRVDYYLYFTPDLNIKMPDIVEKPKYVNFLKNENRLPDSRSVEQIVYRGVKYNSVILTSYNLTPTASGEYELDQMTITVPYEDKTKSRKRRGSIFDDPFGDDIFSGFKQYSKKNLVSESIKLKVKDFPMENKPNSFSGVAGDFKINSNFDKDSLAVDDALNFKITISGKGNFRDIKSLNVEFPSDFEVYDPVRKESENKVIFEYIAVPRNPGSFTIKGGGISYFNTSKERYEQLEFPQKNIIVTGSGKAIKTIIPDNLSRNEVKFIGQDIRYLKSNADKFYKLDDKNNFRTFYLSFLTLLLPLISFFVSKKIIVKDYAKIRSQSALKNASRLLKKAEKELHKKEYKNYYSYLENSIYTFLADKLNTGVGSIVLDEVYSQMIQMDVSEEDLLSIKDIINTCSFNKIFTENKNPDLHQKIKKVFIKLDKVI